jgi:uridylate kinase
MSVHVISLGGSIFSLSDDVIFDFDRAESLKETLKSYLERGDKFVLSIGGGYICRKYQQLMRERGLPDVELDNVGIATINTNAVILRSIFGDFASEKILRYSDFESSEKLNFDKPIIIAAAAIAGRSSDWDAVSLALRSSSKTLINISNTLGVYSADPKTDPSATLIPSLSWDEYLKIVGNNTHYVPGSHLPFDIMASKAAKENGMKAYMIDSQGFVNLKNILDSKDFTGTIIS